MTGKEVEERGRGGEERRESRRKGEEDSARVEIRKRRKGF